jgi:sphingolipid delta-4 desaturase
MAQRDFSYVQDPEPHRSRTKAMLKEHPEVRELIGQNPMTFWYCLSLVILQLGFAFLLRNQPWWLVVLIAYFVGAFASHGLFVIIHECSHRLVFRRKVPNILIGMLADLPLTFPSSVQFTKYHLKHHSFMGVYELDADLPFRWEAKLIGTSAWRKALWLAIFPVIEGLRPVRVKEVRLWDRWFVFSLVIQFGFDAAVFVLLGPKALVYLALSLFFGIGLHPLGARWVQRHYSLYGDAQETFSYYGPLNRLAFNVGYHNEHHDFPSVPWNNLRRLNRLAPEVYGGLASHSSWTRLLLRFLFDRDVSLYSRTVRSDRGGVKMHDTAQHDLSAVKGAKAQDATALPVTASEGSASA